MDGLSSVQNQAVTQTEGPLVIFAGAGSGKTRVITHRIAYLIQERNVNPEEICAVTFTNKAALEMKERTARLIPALSDRLIIRTFHSLCNYILRREAQHIGFPSSFTIYDMQMQESLIREIIKKNSLDTKIFRPMALVSEFSYTKDSLASIQDYNPQPFLNDEYANEKNKIFSAYEEMKQQRHAMDYGDLILNTVRLFTNYSNIRQKYTSRWKYIMVDEYQDTNKIQNELVRLIGSGSGNICIVGDDDQMIYSWRGADAGNILDFESGFQNTKVIKLEENYRSTANIIATAAALIRNNTIRKDKTLFTNNPEGEPVRYSIFENEYEEAYQTIQKIYKLLRVGEKPEGIAIFYRTNFQSRTYEEALNRMNIPYRIFGGFRFFDRAEIKDIVAYLNVIVNPEDTTSLLRIINVPARGIGAVTERKLLQFAEENRKPLLAVLEEAKSKFSAKVSKNLSELSKAIQDITAMKEEIPPSVLIEQLLQKIGLEEEYRYEEDYENRMENIREFIQSVKDYEESAEAPSLAEYLGNLSLMTGGDEEGSSTASISLMTVHNAKGLEFDHVFLTGMDEGVFPHTMSLGSHEEIEEERRLAYVAITRARKHITISSRIFLKRTNSFLSPSRFINEIEAYIVTDSGRENKLEIRPQANAIGTTISLQKTQKSAEKSFQTGDLVRHRQYGNGKIIEISGNGQNMKARIRFGMIEKNFFLAYTPLEFISHG